jgi:hypothetical protein
MGLGTFWVLFSQLIWSPWIGVLQRQLLVNSGAAVKILFVETVAICDPTYVQYLI